MPSPLPTFGDLGKCQALRVRVSVEEPGSAPGSCCVQTGPSLFPIGARRDPSSACAPGANGAPRIGLAALSENLRALGASMKAPSQAGSRGSLEPP